MKALFLLISVSPHFGSDVNAFSMSVSLVLSWLRVCRLMVHTAGSAKTGLWSCDTNTEQVLLSCDIITTKVLVRRDYSVIYTAE